MPSVHQHVETVLRVIHDGAPPNGGDANTDRIHRSWRRCATEHALDPTSRPDVRIETSSRLRQCRQQVEEHLHVARAGMEQLYKHVSELGYVVLLTDVAGVTLDFIGNDTWAPSLRSAGLALGANWNERHAGTNGVGTCIAEQSTIVCDRDDHFYSRHLGLSCTCTPLHDPFGGFMGALDVSALASPDRRESLHLVRRLTDLYSRMIEDANFMRQFHDHWVLRLGTVGPLVDVSAELMLAIDRDGQIIGANSGARQHLRRLETPSAATTAGSTLVGSHLGTIFGSRLDDIWRLTKGGARDASNMITTWDGKGYHAAMVAPRAAPQARIVAAPAAPRPPRDDARRRQLLASLSGGDPSMDRLLERAERLVDKPVNILIQGETGTGKEVLAHALHDLSLRASKPFVAVNCAAIPETLIESELFGYAPGTFTGARSKGMKGLIQRADGGTLFLDEIGDMPLPLQTRLLRVLAEREVLPLGAERPIPVALNVVAASHRDLRRQIAAGTFREDLYYRLCGATLALPALRERSDKAFLIERILDHEAHAIDGHAEIDPAALDVLLRHDWPGNIRELRNALCYALSIADGEPITIQDLPSDVLETRNARDTGDIDETHNTHNTRDTGDTSDGRWTAEEWERHDGGRRAPPAGRHDRALPIAPGGAERDALLAVLRRHHWNVSAAARNLGTCRATVYRRMKRLDIVSPTRSD